MRRNQEFDCRQRASTFRALCGLGSDVAVGRVGDAAHRLRDLLCVARGCSHSMPVANRASVNLNKG
jgi:hypothetical protein